MHSVGGALGNENQVFVLLMLFLADLLDDLHSEAVEPIDMVQFGVVVAAEVAGLFLHFSAQAGSGLEVGQFDGLDVSRWLHPIHRAPGFGEEDSRTTGQVGLKQEEVVLVSVSEISSA